MAPTPLALRGATTATASQWWAIALDTTASLGRSEEALRGLGPFGASGKQRYLKTVFFVTVFLGVTH